MVFLFFDVSPHFLFFAQHFRLRTSSSLSTSAHRRRLPFRFQGCVPRRFGIAIVLHFISTPPFSLFLFPPHKHVRVYGISVLPRTLSLSTPPLNSLALLSQVRFGTKFLSFLREFRAVSLPLVRFIDLGSFLSVRLFISYFIVYFSYGRRHLSHTLPSSPAGLSSSPQLFFFFFLTSPRVSKNEG